MSIKDLKEVLPIPARPAETSSRADWHPVEAGSGKLPRDYKDFIAAYGTGVIGDFIWIYTPWTRNQNLKFPERSMVNLDALRTMRRAFPDRFSYVLFPEPGGLLTFGVTDNGDCLHWVTSGPPNSWRVAVTASRDERIQFFDPEMTAFLAGIVSRRLTCSLFPDDFPGPSPQFIPSKTG